MSERLGRALSIHFGQLLLNFLEFGLERREIRVDERLVRLDRVRDHLVRHFQLFAEHLAEDVLEEIAHLWEAFEHQLKADVIKKERSECSRPHHTT